MNLLRLAFPAVVIALSVSSPLLADSPPTPAASSAPTTPATAPSPVAPTKAAEAAKSTAAPVKPAIAPAKAVAVKPVVPVPPPWRQFSLDGHTRVKLHFQEASVDSVLHFLIDVSGVSIIKDPTFKTKITLECARPVTLDEAFGLVNAVIKLQGFEMAKGDNWLVVSAVPKPAPAPPPAPPTPAPKPTPAPAAASDESEPVLVTYKIKFANATELARVINEAFTALAAPQQNPWQPPQPDQPLSKRAAVRASAEDYSNTLLVNAPKKQQTQVAALISTADITSDASQKSRVFHLTYAHAFDVEPVVENILDASKPLGRGGRTSSQDSNRNNNPYYFPWGQPQKSTTYGNVIANDRTNTLVVTSTEEILNRVAEVIVDLDKPTSYQTSTFVYVLKNARADVIANLLNQSFGVRESNGPVGGSLTGTGPHQTLATAGNTGNEGGESTRNQRPGLNGNRGNTNQRNGLENNNGNNNGSGANNAGNSNNPLSTLASRTSSNDEQGRVVNVKSLMGAVLLVPNIDTNSIICACEPADRKVLKEILDQLDEIPEQVMIETLVVEANLAKNDQFGVEWNFAANNPFDMHSDTTGSQSFGLQADKTQPQGMRITLTASQYSAFVKAVHTDTKFNVLSTPRIFTTNNATAQINISQSLPYVTNQTVDTNGAIFYNYSFLDVGIVLTVTPRVTAGGYVTMDVSQTANDFQGYTSFNAPIVNQREAQTTVSIADGETVVLGGIIKEAVNSTISKVPIAGDIPLVGQLFRSTNKTRQKTELLVFLTPHIVRNPADARKLRNDTEATMSRDTRIKMPPIVAPGKSDVPIAPIRRAASEPPLAPLPPSVVIVGASAGVDR